MLLWINSRICEIYSWLRYPRYISDIYTIYQIYILYIRYIHYISEMSLQLIWGQCPVLLIMLHNTSMQNIYVTNCNPTRTLSSYTTSIMFLYLYNLKIGQILDCFYKLCIGCKINSSELYSLDLLVS